MSLPRYREYELTGSTWIPEVPVSWTLAPLGNVGRLLKGRGGSKQDASDSGIPCIRYGDLYTTYSYLIRAARGFVPAELATDYFPLKRGDVLFAASGEDMADIGRSAVNLCEDPTVCGGDLVVLRPTRISSPEFFGFACDSAIAKAQKAMMGRGTTVKHIYPDELKKLVIALPPPDHQESIADFLEAETEKIDALIAEQVRLMALLHEKRQAVISHAVTKGLDPNLPTKDSGVEWIGAIPVHWDVSRSGRYLSVLPGFAFPAAGFSTDESDTKLLRGINVGVSSIRWDDTAYWRRNVCDGLDRFELKEGDVVLGMDRPVIGGGVRVATVAAADLPCLLLQRVALLRPASSLNARFLQHVLSTSMFADHFLPDTTGVSVPHISPEQIRAFVMPIPPTEEQNRLVSWIEDQISVMAAASREAETALVLLRERRSALITAAVTGQIDVRGLVETAA